MATIFKAAVPFICLQALTNFLCIVFPQIILYLPSKFYAGH
jgi:TRAP-type mannitol/chloroaromatic compound transport system permease large subunit